jgi:RNA polymerase sigma-70 factor, ECF subfamily
MHPVRLQFFLAQVVSAAQIKDVLCLPAKRDGGRFNQSHEETSFRIPAKRVEGINFRPATDQKMVNRDRNSEDRLLIRLVASGDEAAFSELYHRFGDAMYALGYQMLEDAAEAEDLLQDVLVQIWKQAPRYDPDRGTPFSWAVTILRNRAIDRLRRRRLRGTMLDRATLSAVSEPDAAYVDDEMQLREMRDRIREAISKLPSEQREAIELCFFGGLTHNQISERLDAPLGTIKARIRRGLLLLRERLKGAL